MRKNIQLSLTKREIISLKSTNKGSMLSPLPHPHFRPTQPKCQIAVKEGCRSWGQDSKRKVLYVLDVWNLTTTFPQTAPVMMAQCLKSYALTSQQGNVNHVVFTLRRPARGRGSVTSTLRAGATVKETRLSGPGESN